MKNFALEATVLKIGGIRQLFGWKFAKGFENPLKNVAAASHYKVHSSLAWTKILHKLTENAEHIFMDWGSWRSNLDLIQD